MCPTSDDKHYSYSIYADPATADQFDESRFGGPVGKLIQRMQEGVLLDFLGEVAGRRVLDVGTGTGRAALAAAARGAQVTGLDASEEMLRVARAHAERAGLSVTLQRGDAHALDFPDRAFEASISLRMLMHTPDWRRCLGELCRVTNDRVVFDYPSLLSTAAVQVLLRRLAWLAGRRVETYHVMGTAAVESVLRQHGFKVVRVHRQFVLPIGFHKWIGSPGFTQAVESGLAAIGLLRLAGSPVTILAERWRP
jgi:ubiquinone/menaquinone biosynthesis C-methylase UbiE